MKDDFLRLLNRDEANGDDFQRYLYGSRKLLGGRNGSKY
jgi:hypothetical protein